MRVKMTLEFTLPKKAATAELKLHQMSHSGQAIMAQYALEDFLDRDRGDLKILSCEEVANSGDIGVTEGSGAPGQNNDNATVDGSGSGNGGFKGPRPVPPRNKGATG